MGDVTITLKKPIQHGSETIGTLTLREPVAKDIRNIGPKTQTVGHMLDLAGDLAGQPPSVMEKLSMADTAQVMAAVEGFLRDIQPTGESA